MRSVAFILVAAWLGQAALADEVKPTIDMTSVLLDENALPARDLAAKEPVAPGTADPDPLCHKCPPLTLGRAVAHALFASFPEDHDTPEQKWGRAVLAQHLKEDAHASLTADEIAVIKKQLGKAYGGVLLMQAFPLLDPNAKPPEVK